MNMRTVGLAALITISATVALAQSANWQRYVIPTSSAAVDLPTGLFTRDAGELDPAFGQRRTTADGRANLTVQAFPNSDNLSPAAFLAKQQPPAGILYQKVTPRFFAVSSVRDGKIWYNRCSADRSYMNCILLNYPASEKRQWDGTVTRISNTLSSTR